MPLLQGRVTGNETVVIATLYRRPALIKRTKLTSDFLVIDVSQDKALDDKGRTVVVADKLKVVTGTKTIEAAREARSRHPKAVVLKRHGNTYEATT